MTKQGNPSGPGPRGRSLSVRNRGRIMTGRGNKLVGQSGGLGGGTTRTSAAATVTHDLSPWTRSTNDKWDLAKAGHLMRRAGFGAAPLIRLCL